MKKWLTVITLVLSFVFVVGCSDDTNGTDSMVSSTASSQSQGSQPSSVVEKSDVELKLESTAWQMEGESFYLLFTNDKRVTAYDLTGLDGKQQEVGKYLSYDIASNNNVQTITISHLTQEEQTVFEYQKENESFIDVSTDLPLQAVSVKTFVGAYMEQIQEVQKQGEESWRSQGEINQGIGTLCYYWDSLYQLVNTHLQTTLPQQYQAIQEENKTFVSSRDLAMQEAGKEVEGGSSYPMVTGNVYCNQTKSRIEVLLNGYFN